MAGIEQNDFPIYSSKDIWNGITVSEHHLLSHTQISNQRVLDHRIAFNLDKPTFVRWKEHNGWRHAIYETGSFGIVPNGGSNDINWDNDLRVAVIAIKPEFVNDVFQKEDVSINQCRGIYDKAAYEMVLLLRDEIKYANLAGKIWGELLAVAFTIHLVSHYSNNQKAIAAPKGKLTGNQLKKVIAYCHDEKEQNLNLCDMSAEASLSRYHFIRMFKQTTGISPYQFILQLKIEKAIQLLKVHNKPLSEIAATLGFTDQAHFSNLFKKATGYSPYKFRLIN